MDEGDSRLRQLHEERLQEDPGQALAYHPENVK